MARSPKSAETTDTSTDVEVSRSFSDAALRDITSFDDALRATVDVVGDIAIAGEVLGDGFSLLANKAVLIGRQVLLMEWTFRAGDFGAEYVSVRLVARNSNGTVDKLIINDGSTGIARQLREYTDATGRQGGLAVKNGLRVSEYDTDENGQPTNDPSIAVGRGQTYYLDTSA